VENYGSSIPEFPARFIKHASAGDDGKVWLEELPEILMRCRDKWDLTLGRAVDEIKGNFVGYVALPDGKEAILKVAVPHDDFTSEMEALEIYEGRGINRLLDLDRDLNAILLERLRPGKMLVEHPDRAERAEITGRILVDLHKTPPPAGHHLPHFQDWMHGAFGDIRNCKDPERARSYFEQMPRAQAIMDILREPEEPQILLHGDLHHWNIIVDETRGWMAIDPKGVIGASCLDVGRYICNATGFDDPSRAEMREILLEAIRILSDVTGESEERMFAGAFCDKVTGSGWGLKHPPGDHDERSQQMLEVMIEVGADVDDGKIGKR
jgi:streptomycin 6-kinase